MSTETKTSRIPRIAWKQFLRNQTVKIIGVLIMITLVLIIVSLSQNIATQPDSTLNPSTAEAILNPDGVIAPPNNQNLLQLPTDYYLLIIISSILFIMVFIIMRVVSMV